MGTQCDVKTKRISLDNWFYACWRHKSAECDDSHNLSIGQPMSEKQTANPVVAPNSITSVRKAILSRLEIADLPREVLIESVVGGEGFGQDFVERQLSELKKNGEVYVVPINDGETLEVRRT